MQPGEGLKAAATPSCMEKSGFGHPKEGPPSSGSGGRAGDTGGLNKICNRASRITGKGLVFEPAGVYRKHPRATENRRPGRVLWEAGGFLVMVLWLHVCLLVGFKKCLGRNEVELTQGYKWGDA